MMADTDLAARPARHLQSARKGEDGGLDIDGGDCITDEGMYSTGDSAMVFVFADRTKKSRSRQDLGVLTYDGGEDGHDGST